MKGFLLWLMLIFFAILTIFGISLVAAIGAHIGWMITNL